MTVEIDAEYAARVVHDKGCDIHSGEECSNEPGCAKTIPVTLRKRADAPVIDPAELLAYNEWQEAVRALNALHLQLGPAQQRVRIAHEKLAEFAVKSDPSKNADGGG